MSDIITGVDQNEQAVVVSLSKVLSVTPDQRDPNRTLLHEADRVVVVQGDFDSWMERLASRWTDATAG